MLEAALKLLEGSTAPAGGCGGGGNGGGGVAAEVDAAALTGALQKEAALLLACACGRGGRLKRAVTALSACLQTCQRLGAACHYAVEKSASVSKEMPPPP